MKHLRWSEKGIKVEIQEETSLQDDEMQTFESEEEWIDQWTDYEEYCWLLGPCWPSRKKDIEYDYADD